MTWQAPTQGQATLVGHVNQFLVGPSSTVYYSGSTIGSNPTFSSGADMLGSGALAFTFTIASSTTINAVYLSLGAIGAGADVLVSIQSSTGSTPQPSGTFLASALIPAEWIPNGIQSTINNFHVPLACTLTTAGQYWVVVQPGSTIYNSTPGSLFTSTSNYIQAAAGYNDVYLSKSTATSGASTYSSSTGNWTSQTYGYVVYLQGGTTGNLLGFADDPYPVSTTLSVPSKLTEYHYTSSKIDTAYEWATRSYGLVNNMLCRDDSSFEVGVGTWVAGSNTTVTQSTTRALTGAYGFAGTSSATAGGVKSGAFNGAFTAVSIPVLIEPSIDGTHSLALTATAAGAMAASTGAGPYPASYYPVVAGQTYTASAYFYPGSTARSVNVYIQWYTSSPVTGTGAYAFTATGVITQPAKGSFAGTFTGSSSSSFTTTGSNVSEVANTWTQATVSAVAPAGALYARIGVNILSFGASEVHYIDQVSFNIGSSAIWSYPGVGIASKKSLTYTSSGYLSSVT